MQSEMTNRDIMFRQFQIHKYRVDGMVPAVTMTVNVNVSRMINLKNQVNESNISSNSHITITHIVIKAVADTLINYPVLYSFFDGKSIIENSELAISIPVDIESHVEYIVIHKPELMTLLDISKVMIHELDNIRNHKGEFLNSLMQMFKTPPKDKISFVRQHLGNFPISNFGSLHIDNGSLTLAEPVISGLCIGSVKPVIQSNLNRFIEVMNLPLTITFDHRPLDGAYAAKFLNDVKKSLENPDLLFNCLI